MPDRPVEINLDDYYFVIACSLSQTNTDSLLSLYLSLTLFIPLSSAITIYSLIKRVFLYLFKKKHENKHCIS